MPETVVQLRLTVNWSVPLPERLRDGDCRPVPVPEAVPVGEYVAEKLGGLHDVEGVGVPVHEKVSERLPLGVRPGDTVRVRDVVPVPVPTAGRDRLGVGDALPERLQVQLGLPAVADADGVEQDRDPVRVWLCVDEGVWVGIGEPDVDGVGVRVLVGVRVPVPLPGERVGVYDRVGLGVTTFVGLRVTTLLTESVRVPVTGKLSVGVGVKVTHADGVRVGLRVGVPVALLEADWQTDGVPEWVWDRHADRDAVALGPVAVSEQEKVPVRDPDDVVDG